jgi:transposase
MCNDRGVQLYYLPPYSPDFSPIEESFSYLKSVIRHCGPEFHAAVELKDMNVMNYILHSTLPSITPEKAMGWMGHSGYV